MREAFREPEFRRCSSCERVTYCAINCTYAPWNTCPLARMTRFSCLRRMVIWCGGRWSLNRHELAWQR